MHTDFSFQQHHGYIMFILISADVEYGAQDLYLQFAHLDNKSMTGIVCYFKVAFTVQLHPAFVFAEISKIAELGSVVEDNVRSIRQYHCGFVSFIGFHNKG